MIEKIKRDVKLYMNAKAGHGFDHVERVYQKALELQSYEGGDKTIIAYASLLHDVDDYKFVGFEQSKKLTTARKIMKNAFVSQDIQEQVCQIILNMGYSNRLKGIYPTTKEGQIVSDADMLDAMGALAVVRTLEYGISKGAPIFNKECFPNKELTSDKYQQMAEGKEPCINHFFDKLLKLKGLLFTAQAKREGDLRHQLMVDFLYAFFKENNTPEWIDYLESYLSHKV